MRWPPATSKPFRRLRCSSSWTNSKPCTCQLPTQSHRALARLQAETTAKELGAKSWKDVLAIRWRITTSEANRRLSEASELGAATNADR